MWLFLQEVPRRDDAWAAGVIDRLMELCGEHLQAVWKVRLTAAEAPALQAWLATGEARLGDLLRNPDDRDERLHTVPLLLAGRDRVELAPTDDFVLQRDDELLLVGWPSARRLLDNTLLVDATRAYVVSGRYVPSSWIWRRLSRRAA